MLGWSSAGRSGSRARARARPSRPSWRRRTAASTPRSTACARRRARDGSGRRPRVGHPGAAGQRHRHQVDQGHHADPAQRLPAAQTAARRIRVVLTLQPAAARRKLRSDPGRRKDEKRHEGSRRFDLARYTESVCRLCRREGMKLFLKGERCFKDKCAIERRNYPPGQHGQPRGQALGYGIQLREKQKVKRIYGLLENQFRIYFEQAERRKGITGDNLLEHARAPAGQRGLPRSASRPRARRRGSWSATATSRSTAEGLDPVLPRRQGRGHLHQGEAAGQRTDQGFRRDGARRAESRPGSTLTPESSQGRVVELPKREDIKLPIQEQLIVELYSK